MRAELKVAQYGCGKMAKYTMRYIYEKGASVVCAFDVDDDIVGKDIGDIIGCEKKGVIIRHAKEAPEVLKALKPDAAIIMTMSLMSDVKDAFMVCAKAGVNAISTCEEAFYPWNSSPSITKELDKVAKSNMCTLSGSGYQDVFWGNLIATICGATHKITKIKGRSSYNVEDYGIALARAHGVGLTLEEFGREIASPDDISPEERSRKIEKGEFTPSYMWSVNGWLCGRLGLTVKSQTQKCVPQTHDADLYSKTLKETIKKGDATGMSAVVTTHTEEGIIIESECIGKVYAAEEYDQNDWIVIGEPDTRVLISKPATVELTCATVVNRLPDLINAPPGFITTDKMPVNEYRIKPIGEYTD